MRYITIPAPTTLPAPEGKTPPKYSLGNMLDEFVWRLPEFRSTNAAVADRCADLLSDAAVGVVVEVTDADHEVLCKPLLAAEWPAHVARRLNRLAAALINAPSKDPRPEVVHEATFEPS